VQIEADSLLGEAMAKADSLIADARDQEVSIRAEINRLVESQRQLVDNIRGTLEMALATVYSSGPPRNPRGGEWPGANHDVLDSGPGVRIG
jgi:hypothetical protein